LGLHPDAATVALDNALHQRQSDAGTGILTPMQALEDAEDLFVILRVDADAVIGKRKQPRLILFFHGNADARLLAAAILNRIADQVLKHAAELREIRGHPRQRLVCDFGPTLSDAA